MEKEESEWRAHVFVIPFPGQGHINPMLQFSKRLASRGLKVTLATTLFTTKSTVQPNAAPVRVETFSDGCDEGGIAEAGTIEAYLELLEDIGSKNLSNLITAHNSSKYPVMCLVYDSLLPWGLGVAKHLGLVGATFFTQSCAVGAIYYNFQQGLVSAPVQGPTISMPGLPLLRKHELPTYVSDMESFPVLFQLVLRQFSNITEADWILFNSFDSLEDEVINWMTKQWPMKMITTGPTVPSRFLDNQLKDDQGYGFNLLKPDSSTCMNWLNTKASKSVLYVSFGSLASLGEEQMEEVTCGLQNSGKIFLLVVRDSEDQKLPKEFQKDESEKSLVVGWCPQLEVLAHEAVGCFMTHCGWNSILEALCLGVPMIAMPQWIDQSTNAKFVEDVWKVGVRAKTDEKGIVRREEICKCIREIMEGEEGDLINSNALKLKELSRLAMQKGGSSDKNIDRFVASLVSSTQLKSLGNKVISC